MREYGEAKSAFEQSLKLFEELEHDFLIGSLQVELGKTAVYM
jgi:hypothetical protein